MVRIFLTSLDYTFGYTRRLLKVRSMSFPSTAGAKLKEKGLKPFAVKVD